MYNNNSSAPVIHVNNCAAATSYGMKKSELIFSVLLLPLDFIMLMAAGVVTYFLRTRILSSFRPVFFELNLPFDRYLILIFVMSSVFIVFYAISGLYQLISTRKTLEEFSKVAIASSAGIMAIIIYIFLRQELFDSRFLVLGAWFFAIVFVSLGRLLMRYIQRYLVSRHDFGIHKVMIIGEDKTSQKIVHHIMDNPALGYRVVKHLSNPEVVEVKSAIGNPGIDEVLLANPNYPADKVIEIVEFCHENHLTFRFVPNIYQTMTANFAFDALAGVPLVELRRTALEGWNKVTKRIIDIFGSLLGLIILLPLFTLIALAIKWETEGSVFVHLDRVSRNKHFKLHKFRSMIKDAEKYKIYLAPLNERTDSPLFKIKDDPRITGVGRFLRHFRLDEFPQLWNVLGGKISLVGPRPHQPDEISQYEKHHRRVLAIKAGITGLAQISGSSDLPFEEEVALDTFYIENWSLWQDIKILILTVLKILRDKSAA
ncbi:MAG: sugar transferase [Candidatus Yanofskybacteria bacterium]|nr:sugar transferase [Candidatus Yanofskybacteria bacterium]